MSAEIVARMFLNGLSVDADELEAALVKEPVSVDLCVQIGDVIRESADAWTRAVICGDEDIAKEERNVYRRALKLSDLISKAEVIRAL